jgi:putative aminopeptidase FrvX
MRAELVSFLDALLPTHSPGGIEGEIDAIIRERLAAAPGTTEIDEYGNILHTIPGRSGGQLTVVAAHKDELFAVVRRIDPDGKIWLENVNTPRSMLKYGEGPFDLLTASGVIEGVLSIGSAHTSDLSPRVFKAKNELLTWDMVYLDCKLDAKALAARGAGIGDRALVGRRRKAPLYLAGEYVGGYALDDKAGVAALLLLAGLLAKRPPARDVCLAFSSSEEAGASGAAFLSGRLRPSLLVAIEIAPVAEEYPIRMTADPVVIHKDGVFCYNLEASRALERAGAARGLSCQQAVLRGFGSDASIGLKAGLVPRAACIGFATENTHGYEVAPLAAIENCAVVLEEFLGRE